MKLMENMCLASRYLRARKGGNAKIISEQAQSLWDDPNFPELKARSNGEPGSLIIARPNEQYWYAVVTYRDGEMRAISVRRSSVVR